MIFISLNNHTLFLPISQVSFNFEGNFCRVMTADTQQILATVTAVGSANNPNERLRNTIESISVNVPE